MATNDTKQLIHSLCTRKSFPKLHAIPAIPTHSAELDLLLQLAFRTPPLLEAVDLAISSRSQQAGSHLTKRLVAQEKSLITWLEAFCPRKPHGDYSKNDVAVSTADHGLQSRACKGSLFVMTCESLCRICLLLTVESLADLESWTRPNDHPTIALNTYATSLCETMVLLGKIASTPICKARAVNGPLHFLSRYYTKTRDPSGLQWCVQVKNDICQEAPYLRWDALLPWSLMTLHKIPSFDAKLSAGTRSK
jgi:hypothetical protein